MILDDDKIASQLTTAPITTHLEPNVSAHGFAVGYYWFITRPIPAVQFDASCNIKERVRELLNGTVFKVLLSSSPR